MPTHPAAAAIQDIIDTQTSAWNRGDADAWSACFTEDASFVNILGMPLQGRAHIAERHGMMFRTAFAGSATSAVLESVTPVATDTVVVRIELAVTGYRALPPGISATTPDDTLRTRMIYVITRQFAHSSWAVVAAQNTAVVPAAAGVAAPSVQPHA